MTRYLTVRLAAVLAVLAVVASAFAVLGSVPRGDAPVVSAASSSGAQPASQYLVLFSESGLPAGLVWEVKVGASYDYISTDGGTDTAPFSLSNGHYAYTIYDLSGWHQTNLSYAGTVTVSGATVTEPTVTYYQVTYAVTFAESGLPAGLNFSVTLNGTPEWLTTDGSTDSLAFQMPNGTWAYSIPDISGWHQSTLAYAGNVLVNGAPVTERTLAYTEVTYSVSFSERGLPTGLPWQVTVAGTPKSLTTNSGTDSLTWTGIPNGTYPYAVTDLPGWHQYTLPYASTLLVNGSGVTEPTLTYAQVFYTVNFTESGLPAGLTWEVRVGGTSESLTTDGGVDSLIFTDGNGTFAYTIFDVSGWHQTTLSYTGSVGVNGAPVTEAALEYTQILYTVTFDESGLPSGTNWSVNLSGTLNGSNTTTISFIDPNGTYGFVLGLVPGYYSSTEVGVADVTGPGLVVPISFVRTTYSVTFAESGLPSHTSWSVTLNGNEHTTTGTSTSFVEPNGTYLYAIGLVAGYVPVTRSADVTVNGTAASVPVVFTLVKYTVSFSETGLPTKHPPTWEVALGGTLQTSSKSSIVFSVANGTYTYLIAGPAGYQVSVVPPEGTVTVNGASVVLSFNLLKGATTSISFHETGLATGSSWCVTVGWTSCTTTTSQSFKDLTPGTYAYQVGVIPGFVTVVKLGKTYAGVSGTVIAPPAPSFTVRYTFPVTFTESGLPHGTTWTVAAGGFTNSSTSTTIVLDLTNGTYGFSVHKITGYLASPPSGHFLVQGAPVPETIHFVVKPSAPSGGLVPSSPGSVLERFVEVVARLL